MDAVNQAIAQLSELFRSMSAGSRITAGLLLVVAVASVGFLFQNQVTGGDEFLFNGASIPPAALNKMEMAFGQAQLNSYTIVGSRVKVPRSVRAQYMAALADHNAMPPEILGSIKEALDSGLITDTPRQREERTKVGLQRELATIVGSMQGIENASVLLDQQIQPGIGEGVLKTASVFVHMQGSAPLEYEQGKKICYLIVGAWAGLKPENVTVADQNGGIVRVNPNDPSGESQYQAVAMDYERNLRDKVLNALSYIRGVTVTPTVILDTQRFQQTSEIKRDAKPVPVRTSEETVTDNRETAAPGGAPGVDANQPRSLEGGSGNRSKPLVQQRESSKTETVNDIGTKRIISETAGFTPKRANVSIGIPNSYYVSVWQERNPVKTGEEVKKPDEAALQTIRQETLVNVQKTVANLLPPAEGVADLSELVQVMSFQDIKVPEIAAIPITQSTGTWFAQNWRTLAMGGLVIVTLLMLRSMIGSIPTTTVSEVASARVSANEAEETKDEPVEVAAARRLRKMTTGGPSLRDELSDLVKDDPDSAANILRAWIGQVT